MGQGVYTTMRQAVCEETGLSAGDDDVDWDKEMGAKCGETWASRGNHARVARRRNRRGARIRRRSEGNSRSSNSSAANIDGEYVCDFTTRPGTPEAKTNPTTHLTFSYATQVVILDEEGSLERVVAAHDVGRAINPRLCAEQMEGGVHMGLGYALSEKFRVQRTGGRIPCCCATSGSCRAKDTPHDRRDPDRSAG